MKPFNILVIGAGMYVSGRGTDGYGTVMPAILEWKKKNDCGHVFIAGRSKSSVKTAREKIEKLKRNVNINLPVKYLAGNYKKAIDKTPKPACAIVVVPDNLHREIAGYAVKNGLHTLVVKPLVPTVKEAEELIRLQEKHGVYCAVEFHKRLDCANLKLRDVIREGSIGDPLYFLVEYSQRKSVPSERFKKWARTSNVFQYLGIHYADIIYFATGAVPLRAMAIGRTGWLAKKGVDAYDAIQSVIEWGMPKGRKFTSCILTNWIDPEKTSAASDQKIKVIGTKGRFESDQKRRGITIVTDEKGMEEPNPYFCSAYGREGNVSYKGYGIESICQFLDDVSRIVEGVLSVEELEGKRPTFRQSIAPTAALEAVNTSLKRNGEWVTISAPVTSAPGTGDWRLVTGDWYARSG